MPTIDVGDGRRLAYAEAGSGAVLVMVHGSPGDGRSWARVIRHLRPDRRVLTPDLPGHGGSDPLPAGTAHRTRTTATAIGRLIEACAAPAWLCGHSYGGNVALHAALSQRERVKGLILLEPVFMRALELSGELDALDEARAFFGAYTERVAGGDSEAVSTMVDFWFGPGAFARLAAPVQGFFLSAAAKNAEDVTASFSETVTSAQLAAFDRPVMVACGAPSPPVAQSIAAALARLLPNAQVHAIPRARHGMLDSHAEPVAGLIDQHMAGVAAIPGARHDQV